MTETDLRQRWFPLCARHDVPAHHIFETQLLGQELAIWKGDDGHVNVWENRCPHRGMRLTVGANLGSELRCAYHGYRFAQGSGRCTSVPAQPGKLPPRGLCARSYPTLERGSLFWTRLAADERVPEPDLPNTADSMALYSVAANAPALIIAMLLAHYHFRPSAALRETPRDDERCATSSIDSYSFLCVASTDHASTEVRLFIQPVDAQSCVIHGIAVRGVTPAQRMETLQHHAQQLTRLRDVCERGRQ